MSKRERNSRDQRQFNDMKKAEVMSSTPGTPSSVSPTVSHFQAPTPGPTTAQMIEGKCMTLIIAV